MEKIAIFGYAPIIAWPQMVWAMVGAENKPTFGLGIKAGGKKCGKPGFLFWEFCRMQTSLWIRHSKICLYATDYTTLRPFSQHQKKPTPAISPTEIYISAGPDFGPPLHRRGT